MRLQRLIGMALVALAGGSAFGKKEFQITASDRAHWAFQKVQRPATPAGQNPIDALIDAKLRENGLGRSAPATPRELVRRVYFDLLGLPPAPEAVAAFENDPAPDRYEKLLDHLLAQPQYGERWGRHWLDVTRFAQSDGYERDGEKPFAWRYRDYVIRAFNEDKPYDRFVMEQIAGDEMPGAGVEAVVATAFQRLGVFNDEPDDKLMAEFDALDDIIATTGATFLGLTLGCARCHDHKFDPISQESYYSIAAFFRGIRPYETSRTSFDPAGFAPLTEPAVAKRWLSERRAKLTELEAQLKAAATDAEKKSLQQQIKDLNTESPYEWTLAVRERGAVVPATHILNRGNASTPGAEVDPAFPPVLSEAHPEIATPAANALSSGRRLAFAKWLASRENPLTARVMVNRIWQHHFGRGLVKTTTDFGRVGAVPSHPELLDWLATDFVDNGWSIKKLHKRIMLSETYRQSSRAANERASVADPSNALLWRQNLRRLEAEAVRDALLSIAGTLNPRMGGRGFFPRLGGEVLAGQSRPGLDWEVSSDGEQSRRTVYAFVRRTMAVPLLENFDYSNTTSPLGERPVTTVAPQALMLLNDDFLQAQAAAFADRVTREAGSEPREAIRRAYLLAVNRAPTPQEIEVGNRFIERQASASREIASRLNFRPDVAGALAIDYFAKLRADEFLIGPRRGWQYHRGFWAPPYEGIHVVDLQRSPFALWEGAKFRDGAISATLRLASSTEFASLFFRARAQSNSPVGYEALFDVHEQKVRWLRHGSNVTTVAEAPANFLAVRPLQVAIEARGSHARIALNGDWLLDATDHQPEIEEGYVGVRMWGGAVSLDEFQVAGLAVPSEGPEPARRALESFCLMVLNLNEVVYVD